MIDLHCHMLPGIDDGAPDLETSLAMARMAVADGIRVTACTPHIMPGVYDNTGPGIREAIARLQTELDRADIPLTLTQGADVHIATDLVRGLKDGRVASLAGSRYFLFEPPHHVAPPRLRETVFEVMSAGFHPIVTHPERLTWIEDHYETMAALAKAGAWMQITCGSVTGRFGARPKYWAERMMDEGLVHLLATDAHNLRNRSPIMSHARDAAAARLGEAEALHLTETRAQAVLDHALPSAAPPLPAVAPPDRRRGFFERLFSAA
jgi:protein-tyrosine phosphatase